MVFTIFIRSIFGMVQFLKLVDLKTFHYPGQEKYMMVGSITVLRKMITTSYTERGSEGSVDFTQF